MYAIRSYYAQCRHSLRPERLVGKEGNDHGGTPGPQGGGGRAGAAVMDDGRHAREEPVMRDVADREHVV